jgi:hypothetical protein
MSEFKTIETQEELDNIIKDRLSRNTKTVTAEVTKQFEGYISPDEQAKLTKKVDDLKAELTKKDNTIADLKAKNTAYETASVKTKIAREYGIPEELADRLSGTNEEEYKADAEVLSQFISASHVKDPAPSFDGESGSRNTVDAALGSLLDGLTN